eukprot:4098844-Pyramimonas_sp.AAC.1
MDWELQWTFKSTLGHKRKIDYIVCSASLSLSGSAATNELDCGSDHRAVYAAFLVPLAGASRRKNRSSTKWMGSPTYERELETLLDE